MGKHFWVWIVGFSIVFISIPTPIGIQLSLLGLTWFVGLFTWAMGLYSKPAIAHRKMRGKVTRILHLELIGTKPPRNWRNLTGLIDVATAHRLVDAARLRYPGKDLEWLIDKVIWDLYRDRKRY